MLSQWARRLIDCTLEKPAANGGSARVTAVVGLANDELGYILPQNEFTFPENYLVPGGSYEESMSVGPQIGPNLTATLQKLMAMSKADD